MVTDFWPLSSAALGHGDATGVGVGMGMSVDASALAAAKRCAAAGGIVVAGELFM